MLTAHDTSKAVWHTEIIKNKKKDEGIFAVPNWAPAMKMVKQSSDKINYFLILLPPWSSF